MLLDAISNPQGFSAQLVATRMVVANGEALQQLHQLALHGRKLRGWFQRSLAVGTDVHDSSDEPNPVPVDDCTWVSGAAHNGLPIKCVRTGHRRP